MIQKGDELVEIVDREDDVLYVTQRSMADHNRLRMRTARTIVLDPDMNVWVHRRSLQKCVNGGKWDVGTGETPHVGESYARAARRGVHEEFFSQQVSIDSLEVMHLCKLPPLEFLDSPRNYDISAFFYNPLVHGPPIPESEEVCEWRFLPPAELQAFLFNVEVMGVAPVIGQLALYVIKNAFVVPNPLEVIVYEKKSR